MRRTDRRAGLDVDPTRVRQARLDAGMSLADVAGNEVSRTMIHFIEHGRSRPSERVLKLIARRTGKPMSYFEARGGSGAGAARSLASELATAADHVRQLAKSGQLTRTEVQALTLVEVNLHQGAALVRSLERTSIPRARERPRSK